MAANEKLSMQALLALGKRQRELLDVMDRLQSTGLDYDKKLPKIVVIGNQSAGKSSVLGGLTSMPFETNADKCTRFATEIRLRYAEQKGIMVMINPGPERSPEDRERLKAFKKAMDPKTSFTDLFKAAHDEITRGHKEFICTDRLIVVKSGPEQPLMTLVDLPGFVQQHNDTLSEDDMKAITTLAEEYMTSSRTIILAVIGGNSDYQSYSILNKVKLFDPDFTRTIGVVTKPDFIQEQNLEEKFIKMILNKDSRNRLALGWYVMLNPGPRETWSTPEVRAAKERDFFSKAPWTDLPPTSWGAAALSEKLSAQLMDHIQNYLPRVREQAQEDLDKLYAEKESLCSVGDTPEARREHLTRLVSASGHRAFQAVSANYSNGVEKGFFPREPNEDGSIPMQNLRSIAVHANEAFANKLRANGLGVSFTSDTGPFANLTDESKKRKEEFAATTVAKYRHQFRGIELPGDRNPHIPYILFRKHSSTHWKTLAKKHLQSVTASCKNTLDMIVEEEWPEHQRDPCNRHFLKKSWAEYQIRAEAELDRLLKDREFDVQTYDPEFVERFQKWQDAHRPGLQVPAVTDVLNGDADGDVTPSPPPPAGFDSEQYESELVLEQSLILYDIYAKVFINNVIVQVIERHLMTGVVGVFEPSRISVLPDEKLRQLMAESKETIERRKLVEFMISDLEDALDALQNLTFGQPMTSFGNGGEEDSEDEDLDDCPGVPATAVPRAATPAHAASTVKQSPPPPMPYTPVVSSQPTSPFRQTQPPPPVPRIPEKKPPEADIPTPPPDTNDYRAETPTPPSPPSTESKSITRRPVRRSTASDVLPSRVPTPPPRSSDDEGDASYAYARERSYSSELADSRVPRPYSGGIVDNAGMSQSFNVRTSRNAARTELQGSTLELDTERSRKSRRFHIPGGFTKGNAS